ncbi:MAG: acyl-CoA dehydrogenase family protein [Bacillota bacterium]
MDITFSPENELFRQEVRAWVKANLPDDWRVSVPHTQEERDDINQDWDKKLYQGGWAGLSWPKEYGGKGATIIEQLIFMEEMAKAEAPGGFMHGKALMAPTVMKFGTEEQKKKFLPDTLTGDVIWCQGFSEPNAGSDLANVQCKGVIDGTDLVINGQKVWATYAHRAHWCFCLVRTENTTPKHKGISFVLIDMKTPGITVRPLVQINKEHEFSELFLEDVRVPLENVVGGLNNGWYAAMTTLNHERGSSYFGSTIVMRVQLERLAQLAKTTTRNGRPAIEDDTIRQKLAQAYIDVDVFRCSVMRTVTSLIKGVEPGPESYMSKLWWSELRRRMLELAMEIEGPYSQLLSDSKWTVAGGEWPEDFLRNRAETIYAGTSEIQRNIISERVLGMPR